MSTSANVDGRSRVCGTPTGAERGGDTSGDAATGGGYQDLWHVRSPIFGTLRRPEMAIKYLLPATLLSEGRLSIYLIP
jgi:hypothetical protein